MREVELCAVESAENLQIVANWTQVGIASLVQQSATIQGVVCKVVTGLLFDLKHVLSCILMAVLQNTV